MWLQSGGGSENILGEDSWPEEVKFKLPDLIRLVETQKHDFEEGLFEKYMDLII